MPVPVPCSARSARPSAHPHFSPCHPFGVATLLASLWLAPCTVHATAPGDTDDPEAVPVVLSASRLRQAVADVPVTVSILDRATIEASGLRSVPELFRLVPGMYVGHPEGVEGVLPVVSYHGLTDTVARRMQVEVDGRSVYLPLFGTVPWDDLPLSIDDIERIEVVRGPDTPSHGTDAFFAVINIITRSPQADAPATLSTRTGEGGVREHTARLAGGSASLQWRLTLGQKADDGFVTTYDSQQHRFLDGRAEWQASPADTLSTSFGLSSGTRDQGYANNVQDVPRTDHIRDGHLQLQWRVAHGADDETLVQAYLNRYSFAVSASTLPVALPGLPLQTYPERSNYRLDRYDLDVQRTLALRSDLRVVFGGGARYDTILSPTYFSLDPDQSVSSKRLYGHAEWRVAPQWLLQGGAMLETSPYVPARLSPRVSASWQPDEWQTVRIGVSTAARSPLAAEEHIAYAIALGPYRDMLYRTRAPVNAESITGTELAWHVAPAGQAITFDAKLFEDREGGLVGYVVYPYPGNLPGPNTPPISRTPANVADAVARGVELELHVQPWTGGLLQLSTGHTRIASTSPDVIQSVPRNLVSALMGQQLGAGWSVGAAWYQASSLHGVGTGQSVPLSRRFDAHVAHQWRLGNVPVTWTVGGQDLFGTYQDFQPSNLMTPRLYTQLDLGL